MASGSEILEQQVAQLRGELKAWEKAFAAANGGRKAGRDDIKREPFVVAKYKEFDRLRRPIDKAPRAETPRKPKQLVPGSHHKRDALRERAGNALSETPVKPRKSTTSLEVVREEEGEEAEESEPTPAFIRCALGPTPQKDGQVLGIFDMLPSGTPSKAAYDPVVPGLSVIAGTPSKRTAAPSSGNVPSATPQSSTKRRLFDAFAGTPLKRQRTDDGPTPSTSRRYFATPSFLRRSFPLAPVEEETETAGPPFKKRSLVRSLSSIIQGLRKQEDTRMDDDWDIMDELEAEERGEKPAPAASRVLVEDSQGADMPLGPDEVPLQSDDEAVDAGALGADGQPRKVWKKKGQKRQTKRTKMKPVLHKPKKASDLAHDEDDSDGGVIEETQQSDKGGLAADNREEDGSSDYDDDEPSTTKRHKNKQSKPVKEAEKDREQSPARKPVKKVSAQAHANFRALKIKNKNSKANGRGRKFGRR